MDDIDVCWNKFMCSGKIGDYLAYCSLKDDKSGANEGKNIKRCSGNKGNERG